MNKKVIKTVDVDGNELELAVFKPTSKQNSEANIIYSREWLKAESQGCELRMNLDKVAEKHGFWNEGVKKQVEDLEKEILDTERKLRAGSTFYKTIEDGKKAALHIKKLRNDRLLLLSKRSSLDQYTAESYADTARTNYLISNCVVYNNNGKHFFRDVNDYLERGEEKATIDAANAYLELIYEDLLNYESKQYENIWLKQFGFVDDKFRLINKDKHLIDSDGRLINEQGRYVDSKNNLVDGEGNVVDEDGNYVIEFVPFSEESNSTPIQDKAV